MKSKVKLLFGHDCYLADIEVSPKDLLTFLRQPFGAWFYPSVWDEYIIENWTHESFHYFVISTTAHFSDEDFQWDPRSAEWDGFRLELSQDNAEAEFVFSENLIFGEIRPDFEEVSTNLVSRLRDADSLIQDILADTKSKRG